MSAGDNDSLTKISYTEALRRALQPIDTPFRVLDVGCGDGSWLRQLGELFPHAELHGVDILAPPEQNSTYSCFFYHQTSALSLPFPSSHFHLVHTRKLLSSIADFTALVGETTRVLAPRGLGVWVEGRNVANSRTPDGKEGESGFRIRSGGLKALMAKKMMASKGLEGDLASSLPLLLERHGILCTAAAELSPLPSGGLSSSQDLGFNLDGSEEGSATMYAFYGLKNR